MFPSERTKVAYVVSLLSRRAREWGTAMWDTDSPCCASFKEFLDEKRRVFDRSLCGREAARELLCLQQGNRTTYDYAIDFRTLVASCDWDQQPLFDAFFSGLPRWAVTMATDAREAKHDTHVAVTVPKGPERRQQGKFQPFRRLFGKRKNKRERNLGAAELKASFSTGEVCNGVVSDDEDNLRELSPVVSRAISHDSVFTPEEPPEEADPDQTMSQENMSDKVRNLQKQIAQGIKFGQKPPSLKKSEDECSSDEEELPQSPLKVMAQVEMVPADTEPKVPPASQPAPGHSTPAKSPRSRRVLPPAGTIESINLDAMPQCAPRLDNTAAKHRLSVKPKNQRISRKHRRFTQ
ncbi:hypothetical protein NHX12_032907, partial [Muraenolepis orangiensis]